MDKPTMVCGMEIFYSTALGKYSVFALTASINSSASKYFSTSKIQKEDDEDFSCTLNRCMTKALGSFSNANNGSYPERVIFYRDGVGEE